MGFRFRRSLRLLPGVRLNFSGSGISTSIGGHGATINLSRRGTRATVGVPGSGLSYSTFLKRESSEGEPTRGSSLILLAIVALVVLFAASRLSVPAPRPARQVPAAAEPLSLSADSSLSTIVVASVANCRREALLKAAIVTQLRRGASVTVADQASGWSRLTRSC